MKICILNNLYPPYARGGAEQVVYTTVQGLLAAGHQVVVVTTSPEGASEFRDERLTIYRYRPWNIFFYTEAHRHGLAARFVWHLVDMFHVASARYVESILRSEQPDVVHTHNIMGMSFLIPRIVCRLKLRHVHTVHDVQLAEPSGIILKKKENMRRYTGLMARLYTTMINRLVGSPDIVISPSQFLLDFYVRRGFFGASRRVMLRNPVAAVQPLPRLKSDGRTHFLYLGQIEEHKGILFLVSAVRSLLEEGAKNLTLHVAGTGSRVPELETACRGLKEIIVHGKVARQALPQLFAESDATIVPSLCYENSPTVIFESFSYGVPVIASRVEGIAELIQEGENGMTFETENAAALKEKLRLVIEHPERLTHMAAEARGSIGGLSENVYISRLNELYQSLMMRR